MLHKLVEICLVGVTEHYLVCIYLEACLHSSGSYIF